MIKKARAPVPLHLLDHMIIPIHVGNNHWFPAHLYITQRQMTFLDSLHSYSSKWHARHEMLIWKFNRMAWERHVAKEFPPPNWYLSPADFTRPDNWLLATTPVMAQVLKIHQKLTVQVVTEVVGDFIIEKRKRQGICLWQEDFFWTLRNKIGGDEANLVKCLNKTVFTTISKRHWHVDITQC